MQFKNGEKEGRIKGKKERRKEGKREGEKEGEKEGGRREGVFRLFQVYLPVLFFLTLQLYYEKCTKKTYMN